MARREQPIGQICEYCHLVRATHFCSGCGRWVCGGLVCNAKATGAAIKKGAAALQQLGNRYMP